MNTSVSKIKSTEKRIKTNQSKINQHIQMFGRLKNPVFQEKKKKVIKPAQKLGENSVIE